MKKLLTLSLVALFSIAALSSFYSPQVDAAPVVGFNPGRIIDDSVFTNSNTMTVSDIQAFLNSKVPNCDTNGTQPSEFGGGTRAQWGASRGTPAPFICLKDYSENGRSSAQIIFDLSKTYQINPQVLLVLLQKEQGLVTDTWPTSTQYRSATGYGCPDTAPCDSQYYGLANQLTQSSKMFRAILNNSPTWYTPYVLGNNFIRFNPNASCGGGNVNIENRSTQALYNYTPYQPNQGALNAGYGTAPCGAYGNRNFFLYFRDWFGPTNGTPYSWRLESQDVYSDSGRTTKIDDFGNFYLAPGQKAYVRIKARNTGSATWNQNLRVGTPETFSALKDSSWISNDRAAHINEASVPYDGIGTFDFTVTAPQASNVYYQSFNLVIDGVYAFKTPVTAIRAKVVNPVQPPAISNANMLKAGAIMNDGQSILSSDRNTILRLDGGILSLFSGSKYIWSVGQANKPGSRLVNQGDGNLVLYTSTGVPLWASDTDGKGLSDLHVQVNGNVTLNSQSGVSWSTNSTSKTDPSIRVTDTLEGGYTIFRDQALMSIDRGNMLLMQADGNLVLYGVKGAKWASNTVGTGANRFVLQGDGNLVLYDAANKPVWSTGTDGRGASSLIIQSDGNMVIYSGSGPSWASNTAGR